MVALELSWHSHSCGGEPANPRTTRSLKCRIEESQQKHLWGIPTSPLPFPSLPFPSLRTECGYGSGKHVVGAGAGAGRGATRGVETRQCETTASMLGLMVEEEEEEEEEACPHTRLRGPLGPAPACMSPDQPGGWLGGISGVCLTRERQQKGGKRARREARVEKRGMACAGGQCRLQRSEEKPKGGTVPMPGTRAIREDPPHAVHYIDNMHTGGVAPARRKRTWKWHKHGWFG